MEGFIDLLHERNKYLREFYNVNKNQLLKLDKGMLGDLQKFYSRREIILQALNQVSEKIGGISENSLDNISFKETDQCEVQEAIAYKEELVSEILFQDLKVLSFVESAKTDMIQDLMGMEIARQDMNLHFSKNTKCAHHKGGDNKKDVHKTKHNKKIA